MKRFYRGSLFLLLLVVSLTFGGSVFAQNVEIGVDSELKDPIVIRSMQDLEKMNEDAIEEYDSKLDSISEDLKNKFYNFENDVKLERSRSFKFENDENIDLYVEQFILEFPEYRDMDRDKLISDIELLRFNPVVGTVRAFFNSRGYELALTLFNHSLTDNPAPSTLDLTGNYSGMYSHIKGLLYDDGFVEDMAKFARAGSNYETISNSSRPFQNGDLYWAIHGFTWKRTRTMHDKAYFKIIDVYDFNKWKDIPGIVAGFSGTNDFDIEIYGLVQNGTLQ